MNISITNACNRRCAYCFQKDWYLSKKANQFSDESVLEMSLEDFERLCKWSPNLRGMKLMGGEPLLYSQLPELLDIAKENKKKIIFISNISVEEELFEQAFDKIIENDSPVVSVLVNTDYPKSQERIFKENLALLCSTKLGISLSTTLLPGSEEIEKSRSRISELAEIYKRARGSLDGLRVRLAPFCPNPTDSTGFKIYNFTQDVMNFVNSLFPTGIQQYGFDCPINLCELTSDFVDACRKIGVEIKIRQCGPETGMPFDVLVDHSVIWCSSANFIRLDDWREYPNMETAKYHLSQKYYEWWREHSFSSKCKGCEKLNPGLCSGFCIAKTQNFLAHENRISINPIE